MKWYTIRLNRSPSYGGGAVTAKHAKYQHALAELKLGLLYNQAVYVSATISRPNGTRTMYVRHRGEVVPKSRTPKAKRAPPIRPRFIVYRSRHFELPVGSERVLGRVVARDAEAARVWAEQQGMGDAERPIGVVRDLDAPYSMRQRALGFECYIKGGR